MNVLEQRNLNIKFKNEKEKRNARAKFLREAFQLKKLFAAARPSIYLSSLYIRRVFVTTVSLNLVEQSQIVLNEFGHALFLYELTSGVYTEKK